MIATYFIDNILLILPRDTTIMNSMKNETRREYATRMLNENDINISQLARDLAGYGITDPWLRKLKNGTGGEPGSDKIDILISYLREG